MIEPIYFVYLLNLYFYVVYIVENNKKKVYVKITKWWYVEKNWNHILLIFVRLYFIQLIYLGTLDIVFTATHVWRVGLIATLPCSSLKVETHF